METSLLVDCNEGSDHGARCCLFEIYDVVQEWVGINKVHQVGFDLRWWIRVSRIPPQTASIANPDLPNLRVSPFLRSGRMLNGWEGSPGDYTSEHRAIATRHDYRRKLGMGG